MFIIVNELVVLLLCKVYAGYQSNDIAKQYSHRIIIQKHLNDDRHQEAQEAREEVDQGHGYQVPPQPEVLQEGQQARRG
mgnify:CR=1 FL=1